MAIKNRVTISGTQSAGKKQAMAIGGNYSGNFFHFSLTMLRMLKCYIRFSKCFKSADRTTATSTLV